MMREFADEMDRMFGGFGFPRLRHLSPWSWNEQRAFSPEIQITNTEGKLLIRADLPGLSKDDVQVDVSDNAVTIEGERKSQHEENKEGIYRSERSYGHFRREIPLPEGVKTDTAKATFKNGTLEITLDAPQTSQSRRRIEIGEEQSVSKKTETAA